MGLNTLHDMGKFFIAHLKVVLIESYRQNLICYYVNVTNTDKIHT